MNKSKKNWLVKLLIIIIIVAITVIIYLLFNPINCKQKECEKCPIISDYEKCLQIKNEEVYIKSYNDRPNFLSPFELSRYNSDFVNNFYGTGIKLEDFSKQDLITSALYMIGPIPACSSDPALISLSTINSALNYAFNYNKLQITLDDLKEYDSDTIHFKFENDNIYIVSSDCGAVGPNAYYSKKIEKMEIIDNNLYIYYHAAYLKPVVKENNEIHYKTYKASDINEKEQIEEIENENNIVWSKYTLYKTTFELINTDFYFRSNEIVEK